MPASPQIDEHISEQARIAGDVFRVMADIVAEPVSAPWPPSQELVTAAIYFTEPWTGAMMIECALPLACGFTARLMSVPVPETVDADVSDSLAELINMIAGNFKALLPAGTGVSIPSVVRGRDYILQLRGSKTLSQIVFGTEMGQFCLTLVGVTLK
jgi:CheY-specific phosphatase CheX